MLRKPPAPHPPSRTCSKADAQLDSLHPWGGRRAQGELLGTGGWGAGALRRLPPHPPPAKDSWRVGPKALAEYSGPPPHLPFSSPSPGAATVGNALSCAGETEARGEGSLWRPHKVSGLGRTQGHSQHGSETPELESLSSKCSSGSNGRQVLLPRGCSSRGCGNSSRAGGETTNGLESGAGVPGEAPGLGRRDHRPHQANHLQVQP